MTETLHIIGGGMAGAEAAWQAARMGVRVTIHEMRPKVGTFAHRTGSLAEMVCSNSFRSDDDERNAVGLLHWEMGAADGIIMQTARAHRLPAGGALAVDRDPFAEAVTRTLRDHPLITIEEGEIRESSRPVPSPPARWPKASAPPQGPSTSPSSTPSPPSSMPKAWTCRSPGCSRAMTRARRRKNRPPT